MTITPVQLVICLLVLILGCALAWAAGRQSGFRQSDYQTERCSSIAPAYGYRWGLYDPNGYHHCALYN